MFKIEQDNEDISVIFNNGVYEAYCDGTLIYSNPDYETVREFVLEF